MRVIVLGAGVIGVTTAFELCRDGHEVTVIERNAGPAGETSHANAGLVAPGHTHAWADPRAPMMLLRSLYRADVPLRLRRVVDPRLWGWGLRFLRNCTEGRARRHTVVSLRLARYSQERLAALRRETGIAYDAGPAGNLYLYRDRAGLEAGAARSLLLNEQGVVLRPVDLNDMYRIEPAYRTTRARLAGALYCASDESGDCRAFTEALAAEAAGRGVAFRYATTVEGLESDGRRVRAVLTDNGRIEGDAVVLALGCWSPRIARRVGLRLPVYPVKGYSITVPVADAEAAPRHAGIDERHFVAFSRLGETLRFTAAAEFAGFDSGFREENFTDLLAVARELFPEGGDYAKARFWACLRPMTPDGPPLLGPAGRDNLYLNTGHGSMGWTQACGSARAVADMVSGRAPEVDLDGLAFPR